MEYLDISCAPSYMLSLVSKLLSSHLPQKLNNNTTRSIILYITCTMSLIWRGGTAADTNRSPMTQNQALAGRVSLTVLLAIGIIYLILVILTLRHFGDQMDEAWQQRLARWVGDAQRERAAQRVQEPVISRNAAPRRPPPRESPEYIIERRYGHHLPPLRPPHFEAPVEIMEMSG